MDLTDDNDFWKEALAISSDNTKPAEEKGETFTLQINDVKKLDLNVINGLQNPIFVTRNGIYLTVTGIDYQLVKKLCNKFTVRTKSNFGAKWNVARGFNLIKQPNSLIVMLPRFGFLDYFFHTLLAEKDRLEDKSRKMPYADLTFINKFFIGSAGNINNQIIIHPSNPTIVAKSLKLESHQQKIINFIMQGYFNSFNAKLGYAGLNLKLKTGAGKSYIALGLIDQLKQPTLLIVHNQPQAEDMYDLAKKYFPDTSVGIYHSKEKKLGQIMIVVIHSACGADDYNFVEDVKDPHTGKLTKKQITISIPDFFNRFGFVIFDESHKYCSPEFSKVYSRCQSTYMLGLSATPGERIDGFDPITYWNVGQLVDVAALIPDLLQDEPFNTKILGIKYCGSPDYTVYKSNEYGMFDNNATLIQMMEDPHRLNLVVNILEFLYANNRNVYIFSDRLEYLNIIRRALFDKLRKSDALSIKKLDTLDDDLIKFMENKPDYKNYALNLQKEINDKIAELNKTWQSRLSTACTKEFYESHYNEATKWIQNNDGVNPTLWYINAYRHSPNFGVYQSYLQNYAKQSLKDQFNSLTNAFNEEIKPEYYEHLMETYKKNYIDQIIESKTGLSILTGGATGEQISSSATKATMIFTTYGYMGTGKSIPKMDTILFVTPRRNGVEQVVGRIFRPGKNKNERWIIDIIDWKINLKSQWYERLDVYERQKDNKRNPNICETEIDFLNLENDQKIKNALQSVFKPISSSINELEFDFSALTLSSVTKNTNKKEDKKKDEKKKKTRIVKKF